VTGRREGALDARIRQTLSDFLEFTQMADRLVARGHQAWQDDEFLRLAGEAVLHRIGEAVARLDDGFTATHPAVRWRAMNGMRNLIAHEYVAVDHAIVWNALESELPRDAAEVQRILDEG